MSSQISPTQEISSRLLQKSDQLKEEIEQLDDKCVEIRKVNPMVPEDIWSTIETQRTMGPGSCALPWAPWELTGGENQAIDEYQEVRRQIVVKKMFLSYITDTLAGLRKPQPEQRITESLRYLADCFINYDDRLFSRVYRSYGRAKGAYERGLIQPDVPVDKVSLGGREINPHILKRVYEEGLRQTPTSKEDVFMVLDEENYTKFTFREKPYLVTLRQGGALNGNDKVKVTRRDHAKVTHPG